MGRICLKPFTFQGCEHSLNSYLSSSLTWGGGQDNLDRKRGNTIQLQPIVLNLDFGVETQVILDKKLMTSFYISSIINRLM